MVISFLFLMLAAIQFNNQPGFETHEGYDVATQRLLAAEFMAI